MLDELEKRRCILDESLAALQGKLEPVLRPGDSSKPSSDDTAQHQTQSELRRTIDSHLDLLSSMYHTIESIIDRLDIPG